MSWLFWKATAKESLVSKVTYARPRMYIAFKITAMQFYSMHDVNLVTFQFLISNWPHMGQSGTAKGLDVSWGPKQCPGLHYCNYHSHFQFAQNKHLIQRVTYEYIVFLYMQFSFTVVTWQWGVILMGWSFLVWFEILYCHGFDISGPLSSCCSWCSSLVQAGMPKPAKARREEEGEEAAMDATSQAEDTALSAERWVMGSNSPDKFSVLNAQSFIVENFPKWGQRPRGLELCSLCFLPQAEGVQVVAVCGVPVCSCSVSEDERPDGRHQQGPSEAFHRARGPRRASSHAGWQPGHVGRRHRLPHLSKGPECWPFLKSMTWTLIETIHMYILYSCILLFLCKHSLMFCSTDLQSLMKHRLLFQKVDSNGGFGSTMVQICPEIHIFACEVNAKNEIFLYALVLSHINVSLWFHYYCVSAILFKHWQLLRRTTSSYWDIDLPTLLLFGFVNRQALKLSICSCVLK